MTIYDWKQISTAPPSKNDKRNNYVLLLIVIGMISIAAYFEWRRMNDLKKTEVTWAIVTDSYTAGHGKHYLTVKYKNNNKIIQSTEFLSDKCSFVKKIGDTIIINYSTTNPETVELQECFWNDNIKKKFHYY